MYPYNRAPQLQPKQVHNNQMPNNQMSNNQMSNNQMQAQEVRRKPIGDKRVLELLEMAMMETAAEAGTYQAMMPMLENKEDRMLLQKVYMESIKHMRLLQDVLYQLTGKNVPLLKLPKIVLNDSLKNEFKKSFLTALENSAFFRNIYFSLPQEELQDTLMELFTDKQNQAMMLQLLYEIYQSK